MAILDWVMPEFSGPEICRRVRAVSSIISVYIIILTGVSRMDMGEAFAAGANDFLSKPFDHYELRARVEAGVKIVTLESELKILQGLLPICAWCQKIRSEKGEEWVRLDRYIAEHSQAQFTHGICPDCLQNQTLKRPA